MLIHSKHYPGNLLHVQAITALLDLIMLSSQYKESQNSKQSFDEKYQLQISINPRTH